MKKIKGRRTSDGEMVEVEVSFWGLNSTRIWRGMVVVLFALACYFANWTFTSIETSKVGMAGLSDRYVTQASFVMACNRFEGMLQSQFTGVNKRIDDLNTKIDEQGVYLRDRASGYKK